MSDAFTYKAFISYSHTDKLAGKKLMKRLENYRVPKRLVGTPVKVGIRKEVIGTPIPDRVGQLFRDREELAAAESLTEEVLRALSRSEFMIVLCSPKAAASRWVNREIIEYKKLMGERRILSVILSGEPFATDNDDAENECFPPALRYKLGEDGQLTDIPAEPLAADFRPEGDGEKRGALKLIAGLLGISLDTLIERDLQRKYRRVTFLTAASVIASLSMGLLTYEAVTAREEADRNRMRAEAAQAEAEKNRGEAEGLIEFMLTDLRDKLEPVGRLDVLDAVGAKAVDYYDRQVIEDMPDDAVGRRSRAFHELGRIQNLQNQRRSARNMFEQAFLATEGLLARDEENSDRIFEHAQSVFWLGYMDWLAGRYDLFEESLISYKSLASKLVLKDPSNVEWRIEMISSNSNLGVFHLQQKRDPNKALDYFEVALSNFPTLNPTIPSNAQLLDDKADTHAWIADTHKILGDYQAAVDHRLSEIAIYEEILAVTPENFTSKVQLTNAQMGYGLLELDIGNYEQAISRMEKASDNLEQLYYSQKSACEKAVESGSVDMGEKCSNADWKRYILLNLLNITEVHLTLGETNLASEKLDKISTLISSTSTDAFFNSKEHKELILWYEYLTLLYRYKYSDTSVEEADIQQLVGEIDSEKSIILRTARGPTLFTASNMLLVNYYNKTNEPTKAAGQSRYLIDNVRDIETGLTARAKLYLADAYKIVNELERAKAIYNQLRGYGYRHPSSTQQKLD